MKLNLGPGFTKTVIRDQTQSRADGTGSVTAYRGQNIFTVRVLKRSYDGDNEFITILDFLQLRIDNGDEAFYFYHPDETFPADSGGTNTTGRYLVQFLQPIADVLTNNKNHNYIDLVFEETFLT